MQTQLCPKNVFKKIILEELGGLSGGVADPHHFNADPDPAFRFKWDVYPAPHQKCWEFATIGRW
jgi:hypothetical protein